jgi:hypothetical protein
VFHFFLLASNSPLCGHTVTFDLSIQQLINIYVSVLGLLQINAANIREQVFVEKCFPFSWVCLGGGHKVTLRSVFEELPVSQSSYVISHSSQQHMKV